MKVVIQCRSGQILVSGSREANVIARDVALATAAASVRIAFMRASGENGLPFLMPIAGEDSHHFRFEEVGRLVLHDLVQFLVEM